MNTTPSAPPRPPTTQPGRSDPDTGRAPACDRPAASGELVTEERDGLTIITPSEPPRLGPFAARVLLKVLLDAAQRGGHDRPHNPEQTPSPPSLERR